MKAKPSNNWKRREAFETFDWNTLSKEWPYFFKYGHSSLNKAK